MCSTEPLSMRMTHQPCQQPLRLLLDQMVLESWIPSTGQGTNLSTRDGNYGHIKRLTLDAMERDSEKTKISYLHHWINGEGIAQIEGWKNNKILISQSDYDALENKTGKYSSDKIESYFTLFELSLSPMSNPLLVVEDLYLAKQGSMTSGEFHSHIVKIVKRCQFPCQEAEERAIRDAIFMGMNSQWARNKPLIS